MNLDDPKLTAFALGELAPKDRPAVESELAAHPDFAAEVEEMKEIAGILRKGLRGEPAGELAPHQRDAIFRAARVAQPRGVPASERPAPLVLPAAKWWDRPGPWQAVAASALILLGVYATNVNYSKGERKGPVVDLAEISIPVPSNEAVASRGTEEPELLSPKQGEARPPINRTPIDTAKTLSQPPNIKRTEPGVAIDASPSLAAQDPSNAIAASTPQGSRVPQVISPGNPALVGADIARNANRPGATTVTDALIQESVNNLLSEAGKLKEGSDYASFERVYRPVKGVSGRYELIRCPSIKVDVEFVSAEGQPLTTPPKPESRVKKVSNPYFQLE